MVMSETEIMFKKIVAELITYEQFAIWLANREKVSYNIGHDDGEAFQKDCVDF